jgi:hypothetical protein
MKVPVLALCSLLLAPAAVALTDLGQGLNYLRIASLRQSGAELSDALLRQQFLIVDLRYTTSEPDAAEMLRALQAPTAKPRLYLLVSPATPGNVAEAISHSPHAVVLGVKGSHPEPQVVVDQSSQGDRQAYAALESGTALAELISGRVEKERYDEASLVQEFKGGNRDARPPAASPSRPSAPRLTDRVLQRAVHLHRALQALKRG